MLVRSFVALCLATSMSAGASRLDEAMALQAKGRLRESRDLLRGSIDELRGSADLNNLARALSAAASISVSLGDYAIAIQNATDAIAVLIRLRDDSSISQNYNTLGTANLYLGNYDQALTNFQKALSLDSRDGKTAGVVTLKNNIGNIYYFEGRYQDALRSYQDAMDTLAAAGEQSWSAKRRQLTIANLAVLYQRLGKEQAALQLYQQLTGKPQALPRTE